MAGLPPLHNDSIPVQRENVEPDRNDKAARVGRNFFSDKEIWAIIGFALLEFLGKPLIATVVCLITYRAIDRFASPPSSTILKVILVVATIGFIAYHMISLIIKSHREGRERVKESDKQFKISSDWNKNLFSEVEDMHNFSEAFGALFTELKSRQQLLGESPIEVDEGDSIKVLAVTSFNEKIAKLRKDYDDISQLIMSELTTTTYPKDYKDMSLLMSEQTERRTKLQDADQRRIKLLQEMIACYDELFKATGIVK